MYKGFLNLQMRISSWIILLMQVLVARSFFRKVPHQCNCILIEFVKIEEMMVGRVSKVSI